MRGNDWDHDPHYRVMLRDKGQITILRHRQIEPPPTSHNQKRVSMLFIPAWKVFIHILWINRTRRPPNTSSIRREADEIVCDYFARVLGKAIPDQRLIHHITGDDHPADPTAAQN